MKKAFAILLFLMVLLGLQHPVQAQEFRCSVQVNAQKLLGSTQKYSTGDKKVFEQMKQAIEDFINTRKWTNLDMEPHEKLDCSFSLILSEQNSATDFKGQVQVQLRRPVFNSTYTTGLRTSSKSPYLARARHTTTTGAGFTARSTSSSQRSGRAPRGRTAMPTNTRSKPTDCRS